MKILIIQMNNLIKGIDRRLNIIDRIISKSNNPDLILLPALSTTSFLSNEELIKFLDKENGLAYRFTKDMGYKYNANFGIGFPELKSDAIFNSYIIGNDNKIFGTARENNSLITIFKKGNYNHIIKTNIGNVYVSIGNDIDLIEINKNDNIKLILLPGYDVNINDELKNRISDLHYKYNITVIYYSNNEKNNKELLYKKSNVIIYHNNKLIESVNESIEIEI